MPIPVMNFQPQSFDEANPVLTGLKQALATQLAQQQLKQAQTQNQFLPQTLQSQLQGSQLANALNQVKLNYAPQNEQADLGLKQAQIPFTQSETQKNLADVPLLQAQAQYEPYNALGAYYGGLGKMGMAQYYNNPTTQLSRVINSPAFQSLTSTNQQAGQGTAQALSNIISKAANPQSMGVPTLQNALSGNLQQSQQQTSPINLSSDDINSMRQAMADSVQKKTTPNSIAQMRYYSLSFDNQMKQWLPVLPNIMQFAGLAGQTKLAADKFAAAAGLADSPQYQQWNAFVNGAVPNAIADLRRAFGAQASVSEKEDMKKLSDPAYWNENPQDAVARYNALLSSKHANDQVISMNPSQASGNLRTSAAAPAMQIGNANTVRVQMPDGKIWNLSPDKISTAQQRGAKVLSNG
jgi:hypothetical protein